MFIIFADTHKIIASNIYENIDQVYGLKLDKEKLLWGSVAPDYLPQYKLIRHYKDESINHVAREIMRIIFISRYIEFNRILDPIAMKVLSKRIGIVSHYLSDYMCLPHANRWTFADSMIKHVKYESKLNEYAKVHDFKKNMIDTQDLDVYDGEFFNLKSKIKKYIEDVIAEYDVKTGFKNDLNFALSVNLKVTYFILDTIKEYTEEIHPQFAIEF